MFRIGPVGRVYRPIGPEREIKEFALVVFFDPQHVDMATRVTFVGESAVLVDPVKSWLLDLYPDPNPVVTH